MIAVICMGMATMSCMAKSNNPGANRGHNDGKPATEMEAPRGNEHHADEHHITPRPDKKHIHCKECEKLAHKRRHYMEEHHKATSHCWDMHPAPAPAHTHAPAPVPAPEPAPNIRHGKR